MSDTKEKILATARQLYNEQGISVVTQRSIAEALGISPGNLTYHFKKKEEINAALYFELVVEINEKIKLRQTDAPTLADLFQLYQDIFVVFSRYRFVFLDFVHFMKSNPEVADHYRELQQLRKQQFATTIISFQEAGLIRPPDLPQEYDYLYERMQVFADFFLSSREILNPQAEGEAQNDFVAGLRQMFYPYLTKQGREEIRLMAFS